MVLGLLDLLTVVSNRIARAFNKSGATRAVALDISKAFDRVWHPDLLHKPNSYGILGQIFGLISSFFSNRLLQVLLMGKWMGLFLRKNHHLRCWGWLSLLNWIGALTLSLLLKLPPRKWEPWFVLWSFFLQRLLSIYKSTIQPCMEYCCHVWAGAPSCYLELLDKLQKQICRTVLHLLPLLNLWLIVKM